MTLRFDRQRDPPAPVLMVRVESRARSASVLVAGLVDTGADVTVVPARLARALGLPRIGRLAISGVDGRVIGVHQYGVRLRFADGATWSKAIAMGDELIIGRDVLNLGLLHLDGPRLRGSFRRP